ncbi:hypothetical protein T01_3310 [Trichinella spiralis]|uniref:Uncharacterized protein n=1 Tax=Trichinella spiralis TaxID=6334 RepID=A0A0V1BAE2_TRISP|nr:hypothetical protein T01_3310 [Trichinella spiralis]
MDSEEEQTTTPERERMSIWLQWSKKRFFMNDMFIDSIAIALQGETMGMHKVRIVSLSPKAVSKQDGIVKVPEETDCNEHL